MKRKKRRNSSNKIENLTQSILAILRKDHSKPHNYKQLASKLGVDDPSSRNQIIKKLKLLQVEKTIQEVDRGKYIITPSQNYYTGRVDMAGRGQGYIIVEDLEEDIYVKSKNLNKSLNGDIVEVYVFKRRKGGKTEGEVTKIIERKKTEFVGTIDITDRFAFVNVADHKMVTDIFISKNNLNGAQQGEMVLVSLDDWPQNADSPFGTVLKRLGMPGEHHTEIHAILAQYGLPYEFPEAIEEFANKIDTSIQESEIKKRRDMRKDLTFTIDPKDAKDFDDALSFKTLENGNYEIGIHIADVSHYLKEGTILDDEAFERATSVYLVDRVVPMLPEILSNGACSLRPDEEKLTFSAVFELNNKAKIIKRWFGRTVTYSDKRFAYEEAQAIIETQKNHIPSNVSITGEAYDVKEEISDAILKLNELSKILRENRMKNGAISFDRVEVKFNLDKDANPVGVYFKEAKDANKLIEEFMLLANRKVAEFIGKNNNQPSNKTFIYRVHDEPDIEKLATLQNIVYNFGYKMDTQTRESTTQSLNKLLKDVHGKAEANMIETLAIRSMSKAVYTTQNIGHYGLAFNYYSHFTSPIRRYPDVMTHRLLQHYLDGKNSPKQDDYEVKCKHTSKQEELASKAERQSIKYMQVKYMQDHLDEEFSGVISGVTEWGLYVEITSNKCEGMVRIRDIKNDYYIFEEKQHAIVGQTTKHIYQLGDEVTVKVKHTDLERKHLDFTLIEQ